MKGRLDFSRRQILTLQALRTNIAPPKSVPVTKEDRLLEKRDTISPAPNTNPPAVKERRTIS